MLLEDNLHAELEFSPDAFELPDFEFASLVDHSDMQQLRPEDFELPYPGAPVDNSNFGPEDFELPDLGASVDKSDFGPEDFELPNSELPTEHILRPEDFELPEIEALVDNTDMDAFAPNDFELPDLSCMCSLVFTSYLSSRLQAVPELQNHEIVSYRHLARQSLPNFVHLAPNTFWSATAVHRVDHWNLSSKFAGM